MSGEAKMGELFVQAVPGLVLAFVIKVVLDFVADVIRRKDAAADLWWFSFVAMGLGGIAAWFTGIDFLAASIPSVEPLVTRLLSVLLIACGPQVMNTAIAGIQNRDYLNLRAAGTAKSFGAVESAYSARKIRGW